MTDAPENMPETLLIRDTKLHDDLGGTGQRIYTTAGAGYKKTQYTRTDIAQKVSVQDAVKVLLEAYDGFMSGGEITEREMDLTKSVSLAASFGAAAYEAGMAGGNDVHALARSFLLALIDPTSEQLDYLRSDPSSGEATRAALVTQGEE